jgi:2,3-dihydroxybiphenyl 1,2-dioxygenase
MGYIIIESRKLNDWRRFLREGVGVHVEEIPPKHIRVRLDDYRTRFVISRGDAEDATTVGWELVSHESFDSIIARLVEAGVPFTEGTEEEAAVRTVERLIRFPGPNGLMQEVFTRPEVTDDPLLMKNREGFVTGESGMGHVAITTTRPTEMRAYYNNLFNARLSDYIDETVTGVSLKVRFLRVNQRHHSIAIASTRGVKINPIRTRVQHLNIELASLKDLYDAYNRVRQLGFRISMSIGQHTNDRELSFYSITPSGFEWEVGWNPVVVDEETWQPTLHDGFSIWGHQPEGGVLADFAQRLRNGGRSLLRPESIVPELSLPGVPDNY